MKCPRCDSEVKNGMKYCSSCGFEVPKVTICNQCGFEIPKGMSFCPKCGIAIGENPIITQKKDSQSHFILEGKLLRHSLNDMVSRIRSFGSRTMLSICVAIISVIIFVVLIFSNNSSTHNDCNYEDEQSGNSSDYFQKEQEAGEKARRLVNAYNIAVQDYRVQLQMGDVSRIKMSLRNCRTQLDRIRDFAIETGNDQILGMYNEQDAVIRAAENQFGI